MHKKVKRNASYYAKILIVVAFTLLIYGLILDVTTNKVKLIDWLMSQELSS